MSPRQTQAPSCSTSAQSKVDPNIYVHYSIHPEDVHFPFQVEMFTELSPNALSRCHETTIADVATVGETKYYWKDQKIFKERGLDGYTGVDPTVGFANRVTEIAEGSYLMRLVDDDTYKELKSASEADSYVRYRAIVIDEIEDLNQQLKADSRIGVIELDPDRPVPED